MGPGLGEFHEPDSGPVKPLLWLGAVVGLGVLALLAFRAGERAPSPESARPPEIAALPELPVLAPSAGSPPIADRVPRPEPEEAIDAAARERRQRLASDPARVEAAERILGGFENLFLDSTALEGVGPGEIRGGMLPDSLAHRRIALAAIDTVIAQPENAGVIRAHSVRVLASLVQQPWPNLATPEADQFVLQERGHALASLVKADPDSAAAAYRGIPGRRSRERVATRAVHVLVQGGMGKEEAQARIVNLSSR